MNADLFSSAPPSVNNDVQQPFIDYTCPLCVAASGEYNWGNLCCRARFVTGLPGIDWRRGWMARWKLREPPAFYTSIELAVKSRWENKTGAANG